MKPLRYKMAVLLSLVTVSAMLLAANGGLAAAVPTATTGAGTLAVTTKSLGVHQPTFAGPAATGCAVNCNLLSGPVNTPSTGAASAWPRAGPCDIAGHGRRTCHAAAGSESSAECPGLCDPAPPARRQQPLQSAPLGQLPAARPGL